MNKQKTLAGSGQQILGWSNTNFSYSEIETPKTTEEIVNIIKNIKNSGKKIIARGAGRSYGDQALNNEHVVIDTRNLNKIIDWNKSTGILKLEPGVTFEQALIVSLGDKWTLGAVPGTRFVTVGGALANNIHGKNSYKEGNFGEFVKEFKIITSSGEQIVCSREKNSDLFWGAIGGAGLLGIVSEITLQLIQIPSAHLSVKKTTASSLGDLMKNLESESLTNDFAIAQVDSFSKQKNLGRGTIHSSKFISKNSEDTKGIQNISKKIFGIFPKKFIPVIGKIFLNDYTMQAVSSAKYYLDKVTSSPKNFTQNFFQFTFLLDNMPGWKKVFRYGFFEYEPLVPKEKAYDVFLSLIKLTHEYKMPAYLSAIKIHRRDNFLLSYSLDGYSLGLDIPRQPKNQEKQTELFRKMNDIVIKAGGIIYLAKDAVLTPGEFKQMYKIDEFLLLKKKYDPDELFQSDMYRRIFKN